MIRSPRFVAFFHAVALALSVGGAVGWSGAASADDTPPPPPPGADAPGHHHDHDPAWAACKKQADDQKLERGDARRDFMKNCLKSAHAGAPAAT